MSSNITEQNQNISAIDRKWAIALHLSPLAGSIVPLLGFIVPLGLWLFKKTDSRYLDSQGREVLNFTISLLIYAAISGILCIVLVGFVLLGALFVAAIILSVIAAVKTSDGINYRYPYIIRLIPPIS